MVIFGIVLSSAHCGVEDDSEEMSSGCGVGDVCREKRQKEESRSLYLHSVLAQLIDYLLLPMALANLSQETTEVDI